MVFSSLKFIPPFIRRLRAKFMSVRKPPIIVVCGATGTGKSKLGIELAKAYGGEIINADALQLYEGLDISTNKVTQAEMQDVPHHLMGILDPLKLDNNVHDFRKKALPLIDEIRSRNVMPVLVGGTFYYLESLLWNFLIDTGSDDDLGQFYKDQSNEELHSILKSLDPNTALRLHPNNRRKVLRAIEIARSSKMSTVDHLSTQHKAIRSKSGGKRYASDEVLLLWVHCDRTVLVPRLFDRVDTMIQNGLLQEFESFHKDYHLLYSQRNSESVDYTLGIFQSIGFKEFHNYLILSDEQKRSPTGQKLYNESVELLKVANRKYAKRQINWLMNRFIRRLPDEYIPVYKLDATNPDQWNVNVLQPARDLIDNLLLSDGGTNTNRLILAECPLEVECVTHVSKSCEQCDGRLFVTEREWIRHLASKKHARRVAGLKRKAKLKEANFDHLTEDDLLKRAKMAS